MATWSSGGSVRWPLHDSWCVMSRNRPVTSARKCSVSCVSVATLARAQLPNCHRFSAQGFSVSAPVP